MIHSIVFAFIARSFSGHEYQLMLMDWATTCMHPSICAYTYIIYLQGLKANIIIWLCMSCFNNYLSITNPLPHSQNHFNFVLVYCIFSITKGLSDIQIHLCFFYIAAITCLSLVIFHFLTAEWRFLIQRE